MQIRIRVRFYGELKNILGQREISIKLLGGSTARELLDALTRRYKHILDEDQDFNKMTKSMRLLRNGQYIGDWNDKQIILSDNDVITIFPAIVGG